MGICKFGHCTHQSLLSSIYCRDHESPDWIDSDDNIPPSEQVGTTRTEQGELIFWVGCRSYKTRKEAQDFVYIQKQIPAKERYRTVWERGLGLFSSWFIDENGESRKADD